MSLKHALLGFLNYQPMTGYELKQMMDISTSNFWHAKQSQIYTTLKKMEENGFIVSEIEEQNGRPNRRVYSIAESGRTTLQTWLARPVLELQAHKELLLLKLFFSAGQDKQALLTQLNLQRDLHQQQLAVYQNETKAVIEQFAGMMPDGEQNAILWDATRRFGVMYEQTSIEWLNETIQKLEE